MVADTTESRYAFSRFSHAYSELLHTITVDNSWYEAEVGEACTGTWYGLMRGPLQPDDFAAEMESLDIEPDQVWDLLSMAGAILWEDSDGNAFADVYAETDLLNEAWAEIVAEHSDGPDDGDDGDDGDYDETPDDGDYYGDGAPDEGDGQIDSDLWDTW